MKNELTLIEKKNQIIELLQANNPVQAEKIFSKLSLEQKALMVRENNFNPEIILLAKDATPLMAKLTPTEGANALMQEGFNGDESRLLECATPKQFLLILDMLAWKRRDEPAEEGELPRQFSPREADSWLMGLRHSDNTKQIKAVLNLLGVEALYCYTYELLPESCSELALDLDNVTAQDMQLCSGDCSFDDEGGTENDNRRGDFGDNFSYAKNVIGRGADVSEDAVQAFLECVREHAPEMLSSILRKKKLGLEPELGDAFSDAFLRNETTWDDMYPKDGGASGDGDKKIQIDLDIQL